MRLQKMNDQELGTLVYWETSRSMRQRPGSTPITFIDASNLLNQRLARLNPTRLIAKKLEALRLQIIEGPGDEKDLDEATANNTTS